MANRWISSGVLRLGFLLAFFIGFDSAISLQAEFIIKLPCHYEKPKEDDLDKPMQRLEYYFEIDLTSQKNGMIRLDGMYGTTPGKNTEIEGYGRLEKNGLLQFDYVDSRLGEGVGTIEFSDNGHTAKMIFGPKSSKFSDRHIKILKTPEPPLPLEVNTKPGKYHIKIPVLFQTPPNSRTWDEDQKSVSCTLSLMKDGRIRIDGETNGEIGKLRFRGTGKFQEGNTFAFKFNDVLGNIGTGTLQFHNAKEVTLSLAVTEYKNGQVDREVQSQYARKFELTQSK